MKVTRELNTNQVGRIQGGFSRELADRCPDRLVVFPSTPCTNIGCDYAIQQPGYMNCSFVAAEAGEHTLEAIGQMMGLTREGVRLIEMRAMKKIRLLLAQDPYPDNEEKTALYKPDMAARPNNIHSISQGDQREDAGDCLPDFDDRKLGECGG